MSPTPGLTLLTPALPRKVYGFHPEPWKAVYLCPRRNIEAWRERLSVEQEVAHPYTYRVIVDLTCHTLYTAVELLHTSPRTYFVAIGYEPEWNGVRSTAFNQFWCHEPLACHQLA